MLFWILGLFFILLSAIAFLQIYLSGPVYKGPVSDHFDGRKFINYDNIHESGFKDLLKWMVNRPKRKLSVFKQVKQAIPVPAITSGIRFTFVNHSTFLIQANGINILTDPVWEERVSPFTWIGPKRKAEVGVAFENLPKIDIILLSHNHYDHLDIKTLKNLYSISNPQIITTLGVGLYLSKHGLENFKELDWMQTVVVNSHLKVHCVPAQHFSGRGTIDRNKTLWCGFVLEIADKKIYFAGDTGYGVFLEKIKEKFPKLDVGLIPIGAYKPSWFMSPIHISPAEAVKIHQDLNIQQSLATHFGTFPLADEEMGEPVKDLKEALKREGLRSDDFLALENGGSFQMF